MSHQVSYSKLFTPPKFLERPFVSVEIQPWGIYYLTIKNTELGLIPDMHGFISLPEGTILNGEISKREPIIKALVDIRKKTKVGFVRFSLPEDKTYIFKTKLPNLKTKEIHGILDFKIEENVPLSAKEAVFDFDIISNSRRYGLDIVVAVSPLKIVEDFQLLFVTAGLTPVLFSPESNNVAKSVIRDNNEQIVVIVNIRENNIVFSLVVSGVVCQTSSLNFGSSTFTDLLMTYFKASKEEVVKIKKEKLYGNSSDNMEVFSYLINTISAIKDELYKFISYCNQREDVVSQVDRVVLCGQEAMIAGLDRYLSTNLNIDVDVADIWINNFNLQEYIPNINKIDSENFAIVNGLSLF